MSKTATKLEIEQTGAFQKEDIEIRWIPVGNLIIKWATAQRQEKIPNHAKRIAGAFDADKFGIITVTMADESGKHHVVDGWNRKMAVQLMWGKEEKVPCQILPTKDPHRAAEIFLGMNEGRRAVSAISNFLVSVQAGNPDSIAIYKVVRGLGYRIMNGKADGYIAAIGGLKNIYSRYGPDILHDALSVIQATWGMNVESVNKSFIQAYGTLLGTHHQQVNYGRLAEVIRKRFPHPEKLLGLVKGMKELSGGSASEILCKTLIDNYNRGLKAGQLKQ